jgi:hypothetical protein
MSVNQTLYRLTAGQMNDGIANAVVRDDDGQYKASILAISGENEGNG